MRYILALLCAFFAACLSAVPSMAGVYAFDLNGYGISASGNIYTYDNPDGTYTLAAIDGTLQDLSHGDTTVSDTTYYQIFSGALSGYGNFTKPPPDQHISANGWLSSSGISFYLSDNYRSYNVYAQDATHEYIMTDADDVFGTSGGAPVLLVIPELQNGVPEPTSWALMLIGFGGIGTMMRRCRFIEARR